MPRAGNETTNVIDLSAHTSLPFRIFGCALTPPASEDAASQLYPQYLHDKYKRLYDAAEAAVHTHLKLRHDFELDDTSLAPGALPISYNMAMTTRAMLLCPRRTEGREVRRESGGASGDECGQPGEVIDSVALNGTILGGTMMVKDEEVWNRLRRDDQELRRVLGAVGLPPSIGERDAEGEPTGNL